MRENRGSDAAQPQQIPMRGWKDILVRAWGEVSKDHVSLVAAGIAFYGLLALFPAITALMAISGLIFEPSEISDQIEKIAAVMPKEAADIVLNQAVEVAGSRDGGLGIAALLGLAIALYSASKGVASLIEGLNIAYDEEETRGFVRLTLTNLGLTVFLVVGMTAGLGATLVLPGLLAIIDLGPTTEMLIGFFRWVILLMATIFGIAVLYRVGPDRASPRWEWITPGAVVACILWIAASIGFSFYVENFGSYNESFGTLAGAIVLLMWLWLSAYVVLLGAEINAEAELQTRYDTTAGPEMPMGARGAVKADNVASTAEA